jgi:hypothetical protein
MQDHGHWEQILAWLAEKRRPAAGSSLKLLTVGTTEQRLEPRSSPAREPGVAPTALRD